MRVAGLGFSSDVACLQQLSPDARTAKRFLSTKYTEFMRFLPESENELVFVAFRESELLARTS